QRSGCLRGGQFLHELARCLEDRVPGAWADARFEVILNVYAGLSHALDLHHHYSSGPASLCLLHDLALLDALKLRGDVMAEHSHSHTHEHHTHEHEEDSYYLDQLCMVTMSAAFGAICLAMFFWKTDMLKRLLGEQFHMFVLISGFTLIGLALLRAASLWVQVGR